ncbi:XRE family transcriptional regulator [Mesorhizobium sp. CC13]|uniref:helix-turn-helix domain-containing protein n=1 Tax=Mesorhizobium sp. CC13 TaxID=3029194 RepID=UPI00326707A7
MKSHTLRSRPTPSEQVARSGAAGAAAAPLRQDPHAASSSKAMLQAAIGREIRSHRQRQGLTATDLASTADISPSMLSKIENGTISAALAKLQALSRALGIPLSSLMRCSEDEARAVFIKAGEGTPIEWRGGHAGYSYQLLCGTDASAGDTSVRPLLITATEQNTPSPPWQERGMKFVYVLEGSMTYRHGSRLYQLSPGDSLFLDADCLHGPHSLLELPVQLLSVLCRSPSPT